MKTLLSRLLLGTFVVATTVPASAQIVGVGSILADQMPGSPTDFTFVGDVAPYTGVPNYANESTPGTTDLTDFSVALGYSAGGIYHVDYSGKGTYPTVETPAGYTPAAAVQTAVVFSPFPGSNAPDLLNFTLGDSPGYDYSDFFVFVMYSNVGVAQQDATLTLNLFDSTDTAFIEGVTVGTAATDDQDGSVNQVRFEEFEVKGASPGDVLQMGADPFAENNPVIGGVSFSETEVVVPEPATWALMGLGGAFLLWRLRRSASTI